MTWQVSPVTPWPSAKHTKYGVMAANQGKEFFQIVVKSFGSLRRDALRLLDLIGFGGGIVPQAYQQVNYPQMLRGSLWIFVDLCGYLWIFVDICGQLEDTRGSLWIFVDLCGSLWI